MFFLYELLIEMPDDILSVFLSQVKYRIRYCLCFDQIIFEECQGLDNAVTI